MQTYLDFGQKSHGKRTLCNVCGLLYVNGEAEDEKDHANFCRSVNAGLAFQGWKMERLVWGAEGKDKVVEVRPTDGPTQLAKAAEVKRIMDQEMGFVPLAEGEQALRPTEKAFFYVREKRVVGCVITEKITVAHPVLETLPGEGNREQEEIEKENGGKNKPEEDRKLAAPPAAAIPPAPAVAAGKEVAVVEKQPEQQQEQQQQQKQQQQQQPQQPSEEPPSESASGQPLQGQEGDLQRQEQDPSACIAAIQSKSKTPLAAAAGQGGGTERPGQERKRKEGGSGHDKEGNASLLPKGVAYSLEDKQEATLGVKQIWVSKNSRRQGIAKRLVEVARARFYYGFVVPRDKVAFSQLSNAGYSFASSYVEKGQRLLVY